jgi:anthranilate phosphoribosyltransferase
LRTWAAVLAELAAGRHLSREVASWAIQQILAGDATPAQLGAFMIALRSKGETVEEMSAFADGMMEFATPIEIGGLAVDVVGSGGDRARTVNISTMAAIVVAATGARVIKHGNRAATSACGAADVLEALGIALDLTPEQQQQVVDRVGIGFLFAPYYHPALRHASSARRELGIPTSFNFLGPLANPAQPVAQAVGVSDVRMAELMAGVFAARGNQGLVVHGDDGLDELTTTTSSTVWLYRGGEIRREELDPRSLGLPRAELSDLVGGEASVNARVVREVLDGKPGPVQDIVVLNAAAARLAYDGPGENELAAQLEPRLVAAREAIESGAARSKLQSWVEAISAVR